MTAGDDERLYFVTVRAGGNARARATEKAKERFGKFAEATRIVGRTQSGAPTFRVDTGRVRPA